MFHVDPASAAAAELAAVDEVFVGTGWYESGFAGDGVAFVAAVFGFTRVVVVASVVVFAGGDDDLGVGGSATGPGV